MRGSDLVSTGDEKTWAESTQGGGGHFSGDVRLMPGEAQERSSKRGEDDRGREREGEEGGEAVFEESVGKDTVL